MSAVKILLVEKYTTNRCGFPLPSNRRILMTALEKGRKN